MIRDLAKPVNKYLKLVYLCRVTLLHNDIADKKFNLEIIKRWKFYAFMQKLARKKLESLYKNMQCHYLNMANEVFGDEANNQGVVAEFSFLSEKMGMFKYESEMNNDNIKKTFVKSIKKKYDFGPIDLKSEKDFFDEEVKDNDKSDQYEILEGEGDESFIMGREDNSVKKK